MKGTKKKPKPAQLASSQSVVPAVVIASAVELGLQAPDSKEQEEYPYAASQRRYRMDPCSCPVCGLSFAQTRHAQEHFDIQHTTNEILYATPSRSEREWGRVRLLARIHRTLSSGRSLSLDKKIALDMSEGMIRALLRGVDAQWTYSVSRSAFTCSIADATSLAPVFSPCRAVWSELQLKAQTSAKVLGPVQFQIRVEKLKNGGVSSQGVVVSFRVEVKRTINPALDEALEQLGVAPLVPAILPENSNWMSALVANMK